MDDAGLGWVVKLQKGEFLGKESLLKLKSAAPSREIIGLRSIDRSIPRHGSRVLDAGQPIGSVTSGTYSFFLNQAIALASVQAGRVATGSRLEVEGRGGNGAAEVVPLPFYRGSVHSPAPPARAEKTR